MLSLMAPAPEPIEIGSRWVIKDGSPWGARKSSIITVTDVLAGWVRYKIGEGVFYPDERMKEESFRHCYQPAQKIINEIR